MPFPFSVHVISANLLALCFWKKIEAAAELARSVEARKAEDAKQVEKQKNEAIAAAEEARQKENAEIEKARREVQLSSPLVTNSFVTQLFFQSLLCC